MPRQFEVFPNPVPRARRAFPFVVVLQSDIAETGRDRIVAPLAPSGAIVPPTGRLVPVVGIGDGDHAVLVPSLAAVPAKDLKAAVADVSADRAALTAAVDFLFTGV